AALLPWRALPVPFWRYIFFEVALISPRVLVLWLPDCFLASCQRTIRCRMSARGSSPNTESESVTVPFASPASDLTLSSITLLRRIEAQPALRPSRRRSRGSRPASAHH